METQGIDSDHYMSVLEKKKRNDNLYTSIDYEIVPVLIIDNYWISEGK